MLTHMDLHLVGMPEPKASTVLLLVMLLKQMGRGLP